MLTVNIKSKLDAELAKRMAPLETLFLKREENETNESALKRAHRFLIIIQNLQDLRLPSNVHYQELEIHYPLLLKVLTVQNEPELLVSEINSNPEDIEEAKQYITNSLKLRYKTASEELQRLSDNAKSARVAQDEELSKKPHYLICVMPDSAFHSDTNSLKYLFPANLKFSDSALFSREWQPFMMLYKNNSTGFSYTTNLDEVIPNLLASWRLEFSGYMPQGISPTKQIIFQFPDRKSLLAFLSAREQANKNKTGHAAVLDMFASSVIKYYVPSGNRKLFADGVEQDIVERDASEIQQAIGAATALCNQQREATQRLLLPYQTYLQGEIKNLREKGEMSSDKGRTFTTANDDVNNRLADTLEHIASQKMLADIQAEIDKIPARIKQAASMHRSSVLAALSFLADPDSLDRYGEKFPDPVLAKKM